MNLYRAAGIALFALAFATPTSAAEPIICYEPWSDDCITMSVVNSMDAETARYYMSCNGESEFLGVGTWKGYCEGFGVQL